VANGLYNRFNELLRSQIYESDYESDFGTKGISALYAEGVEQRSPRHSERSERRPGLANVDMNANSANMIREHEQLRTELRRVQRQYSLVMRLMRHAVEGDDQAMRQLRAWLETFGEGTQG